MKKAKTSARTKRRSTRRDKREQETKDKLEKRDLCPKLSSFVKADSDGRVSREAGLFASTGKILYIKKGIEKTSSVP